MYNPTYMLIDFQERLANVMENHPSLLAQTERLIKGLKILNIQMLWLEQYPKGLGPTCPSLSSLLSGYATRFEKKEFSAYWVEGVKEFLKKRDNNQVIISGIEAHVCVYQTVKDLLIEGYEVEVVADCVGSRTRQNREIGLQKMLQLGANITSTEMVLFELLKTANHPRFKAISDIIK